VKKNPFKCPFVPMQLVKATETSGYGHKRRWSAGECLLFLGEIKQMPGHCAVVNRDGKIYWGFHTDSFVEPTEDEI
jgi:hypothetical protein